MRKATEREIVEIIEEVVRIATMQSASFALTSVKYPKPGDDPTQFIREVTDLWRESWILEPLRQALKEIKIDNALDSCKCSKRAKEITRSAEHSHRKYAARYHESDCAFRVECEKED